MKKIRIGIASPSTIDLFGLKAFFSVNEDIDLVFSSSNITSLFSEIKSNHVDILLCDYVFNGDPLADGSLMLKRIKRQTSDTKVVFFSQYSHAHVVLFSLKEGASGFVDKRDELSALDEAIKRIHGGEIYLSPSISSRLITSYLVNKPEENKGLTRREFEVVRLICEGMPLIKIAERLNRSPKTISNQKNSAMKKLGAGSDMELIEIMRDNLY